VLFLLCRKWFTCWIQFACQLQNQKRKKECVCVFLGNELWWIRFARIISPRLLSCLFLSREKESELRRWILDPASGVGCRNSHSRRSRELRKEELFFFGGEFVFSKKRGICLEGEQDEQLGERFQTRVYEWSSSLLQVWEEEVRELPVNCWIPCRWGSSTPESCATSYNLRQSCDVQGFRHTCEEDQWD
jgi:hypothetical protein